jgi:hypothetical protein
MRSTMRASAVALVAVPDVDEQLDANVDYGNVTGHFVRVDVTLLRDSLFSPVDVGDSEPVRGYVALSAEEAIAFADLLRERAARIVELNGDGGSS